MAHSAEVRLAALTFEKADHLGMANMPLHGTNILCEFLAGFFVNTSRLNWGHQFFEGRAPTFAGAGVHLSRFTTNNVGKFIQANHKHPPTLHRAATLLLARNEGLREALELSWLTVRAAPYIASYWMTLARAYVSLAYYEHALCAFNSIPFKKPGVEPAALPGFLEMSVPLKTKGQNAHPWLYEPPITYLLYHWPKWRDCPLEWLSHRQTKRLLIYSGDLQGFGFNRMLIDRKLFHPVCTEAEVDFYQGKDSNLHERTLEYDRMSLIHQQVYGHLVDLIKKLGWDAMGDIWFRVFVTQEQGIDGQTFEGVPGDPLLPPLAKRMSGDDFHKIFSMLNADFDEFANVDVELANLRSDLLRSTPLQNWVHAHPPLVWAHWGALCKRLKRIKPMELCFRILLLRGFCPKAAVQLIELYQEHSMVCEALIILGALLNFVMVAGKIREVSRVPLYVNALGASLLESFGEEAVKTALGESPFICGHQGLIDFIEMNLLNGTADYPLA